MLVVDLPLLKIEKAEVEIELENEWFSPREDDDGVILNILQPLLTKTRRLCNRNMLLIIIIHNIITLLILRG
jgi:hypothetical protein